jgi:hypothetical protein
VISFDQDFGEIYHKQNNRYIGVIVLRIKNQTVENANKVLTDYFTYYGEQQTLENKKTLVIIKDNSIRIIK